MEYIKEWLKSLLYVNVLLLLVENLMEKTKYESYLRFFSGILFVFCLMKPLIDLSGNRQLLDVSFLKNQWRNEWNVLSRAGELEKAGEELRQEYTAAMEKQIVRLSEAEGMTQAEAELFWDEKEENISSIVVRGDMEDSESADALRGTLAQYFGLEPGQVRIHDG